MRTLYTPLVVAVLGSVLYSGLLFSSRIRKKRKVTTSSFTTAIDSFVLLGDSLTQFSFALETSGWGLHLSSWYSRRLEVLNRGISGYNTRYYKHVLRELVQDMQAPRLVTLLLGANDSVHHSKMQHVPLTEYEENLIEVRACDLLYVLMYVCICIIYIYIMHTIYIYIYVPCILLESLSSFKIPI